MTHPHHPGSPADPLHRRLPSTGSPMQDYLSVGAYSSGPHAFGYDYDGAGRQSPSHNPGVPYPSPPIPSHPHVNMGGVPHPRHSHLPPSLTPSITFEYAQGESQPQQHAHFFGNGVVNGNSEPMNSLSGEGSASSFSSFHQDGAAGGPMYLVPPMDWPPSQTSGGSSAQQPASTGPAKGNSKANSNPNKVPRHQFTACGACRHRRVKCDLRTRQEEAERDALIEDAQNGSTGAVRRRKVSCTNCQERGTNCVDEYAPLKAAKQLRRGKRISEIEMLYGKSATYAALASQGDDNERSLSPNGRKIDRLPELTREFFDSPFFRRFLVQRPIVDSLDFVTMYLSKPIPCAAAMGPEGTVLCHCLYAWGVSYGVDERGQLDVPEGGGEPLSPLNLLNAGESEIRRDRDRQRRMEKLQRVVRSILREIDETGLLRRPSLDGIRALLLILPLTEGISTPVERQALYQAALSHVQLLCTESGVGYDGLPASLPTGSMQDDAERLRPSQMRIFWYAFVHESITTGLRGGNLVLDDELDLSLLETSLEKQPLIQSPGHFHISPGMATAPVRFALTCRRIHSVLSSAKAKKRDLPDVEQLHSIWDALETSWEEFEALKTEPTASPFREQDEVVRFADGWKIATLEAQNAIRKQLEDRLDRLQARHSAMMVDEGSHPGSQSPSPLSSDILSDMAQLRHLLELARTRCDIKVNQVMDIVRRHLGVQLFEWDASLVRDGTYLAATLVAQGGGSDDDVNVCLQALNESRWAHSKSAERSNDIRQAWYAKRSNGGSPRDDQGKSATDTGASNASKSPNQSPFTSPPFDSYSGGMPPLTSSGSWPITTGASAAPSAAGYSPGHVQRSKSDSSTTFAFHSQTMRDSKDSMHRQFTQTPPQAYLFNPVDGVSPHHNQSEAGQYLLQPDGSHVFVPFNHAMP